MANIISRGFGALQRIITRGFFSGDAPSPDCYEPFVGLIYEDVGFIGLVGNTYSSFVGLIDDTNLGLVGLLTDERAFVGLIGDDYLAVEGEASDSIGFNGVICNGD